MEYVALFYVIVVALLCTDVVVDSKDSVLPSILWDPRNTAFSCKDLTIKVQARDQLFFIHQRKQINPLLGSSPFQVYNNIYLVNEEQYNTCNSSSTTAFPFFGNQDQFAYAQIVFKKDVAPGKPVFEPGKKYYFISTSNGQKSGLDEKINGSCLPSPGGPPFPLKLIVKVCTDAEINDGLCEQCKTASCYEKECVSWKKWITTDDFLWNGTKCLQKYTRTCDSKYSTCDGNSVKYEIAPSRDNCTFYKYCPSSSVTLPKPSTSTYSSLASISCPTKTVSNTVIMNKTIACSPSVSVLISYAPTTVIATSTINKVSTVIKTETKITTKTVTEDTKCSVVTKAPVTERIVYQDIGYDLKFYVTVISAVIGAILVGVFVSHACVSYHQGKTIRTKVITVEEYKPPADDSASSSKMPAVEYPNGTYTQIS